MTCDKNKRESMLKHKESMDSIPNIHDANQPMHLTNRRQTNNSAWKGFFATRQKIWEQTEETQCMTCDKNNKKETLRRTQGLTINQTTMMQMTSNEYNMKDWEQTNIARKQMFETNHGLLGQGS